MQLRFRLPPGASALLAALAALSVESVAGTARAQSAPGPATNQQQSADSEEEPDEEPPTFAQKKKWSVGGSFQTDRTILQEDVGGGQKAFNSFDVFGSYALTGNDTVRLGWGLNQRFIADQTETGIRSDDISVGYSHGFKLPVGLRLGANVSDQIPISLFSQRMSIIAVPRAGLNLSRNWLNNTLNTTIGGGGGYYIVKYKEASSPDDDMGLVGPNPRASVNLSVNVNYSLWFHQQLSIGGGASTSWTWYYDPSHANDPTLAQQFKNAPVEPSQDPYFNHTPGQQGYGWQGNVSYQLPSIKDVQSNFQIAISQGDGVLRDGATHLYWLSRRGGHVSAALTVNY